MTDPENPQPQAPEAAGAEAGADPPATNPSAAAPHAADPASPADELERVKKDREKQEAGLKKGQDNLQQLQAEERQLASTVSDLERIVNDYRKAYDQLIARRNTLRAYNDRLHAYIGQISKADIEKIETAITTVTTKVDEARTASAKADRAVNDQKTRVGQAQSARDGAALAFEDKKKAKASTEDHLKAAEFVRARIAAAEDADRLATVWWLHDRFFRHDLENLRDLQGADTLEADLDQAWATLTADQKALQTEIDELHRLEGDAADKRAELATAVANADNEIEAALNNLVIKPQLEDVANA